MACLWAETSGGKTMALVLVGGPLRWGQVGVICPQRRVLSQLLAESRQPSGSKAWLVFS